MGDRPLEDSMLAEDLPLRRVLKLDGRAAIVTSGDSGIGRAIAIAFAAEGADVAVAFHSDEAGARDTAGEIESHRHNAHVLQLDVRDEASVAGLIDTAEEAFGPPRILVNSAGMNGRGVPVAELPTEDFDAVIRTDLYGPFFCCREFIRRRREAGQQDHQCHL